MTNKKVKTGVLGVGYLGTFHAQKLKSHPLSELMGVYDARFEQAQKVAAELGVRAFSSAEDLLAQVEAVSIASTTMTHFELAQMALKKGVHVNVEKPMTASLEQAKQILEASRASGKFLTVGHIERFNPSVQWLHQLIQEKGEKPLFLELHRMAPFRLRGSDVSVIYDLMIHDLDLLTFLFHSEIKNRQVAGSRLLSSEWDTAQAFFEMESGARAFIHVNRAAPGIERRIKAVFSDEVIFVNTQNHEVQRALSVDRMATEPTKILQVQVEKNDALAAEADHFLKVILGQQKPLVTAEDGLKAISECEKIHELLGKK